MSKHFTPQGLGVISTLLVLLLALLLSGQDVSHSDHASQVAEVGDD